MSNKNHPQFENFRRGLTLRVLTRFLVTAALYTAAIFLLMLLGVFISESIIWKGDEYLYILLHSVKQNLSVCMLVVLGVGYLVIFVIYWGKTLGYLETIVAATEQIYKSDDEIIVLPAALRELEGQMNQIKRDMLSSRHAASEAEKRKNDLVVYLAHDLKTPLTSVIGYLTLLHDEDKISPELQAKYLGIALDKAERLEDLINEFFDITRFSLTTMSLTFQTVNLRRMLEQLVDEFAPMLSEKSLSCKLSAPPDQMLVCDPEKLERVFDNLLRNAINYSYEGEEIVVLLNQCAEHVELSFINHGATIPQPMLEKIFEQFYRLDSARTSKTGGAGLGLAIAKEIVGLHGGVISASSKNEIIEFFVSLPLHS